MVNIYCITEQLHTCHVVNNILWAVIIKYHKIFIFKNHSPEMYLASCRNLYGYLVTFVKYTNQRKVSIIPIILKLKFKILQYLAL